MILAAVLLLGVGCKVRREFVPVPYPVVRDSIVTKLVVDTFYAPLPQVQAVSTTKPSRLETDYAYSTANVDSLGVLHHAIGNKNKIPTKIIYEKIIVRDSVGVPFAVKGDPYPVITVEKQRIKGFLWYSGLFFYICLFVYLFIMILNKLNLKNWVK
jgi:hypothetical protein